MGIAKMGQKREACDCVKWLGDASGKARRKGGIEYWVLGSSATKEKKEHTEKKKGTAKDDVLGWSVSIAEHVSTL